MMSAPGPTCFVKFWMSSMKLALLHTSFCALWCDCCDLAEASRGVHVASSHLVKISVSRGKSGWLQNEMILAGAPT